MSSLLSYLSSLLSLLLLISHANSQPSDVLGPQVAASPPPYRAPSNNQAHILGLGNVQGKPCPNLPNVTMYLGVPYANAPIGDLRFRPPQIWNGTFPFPSFNAKKFPPKCSQLNLAEGEEMNEDCLFLNIYAPAKANPNSIATRVFFHGGWFQSGSASETYLDGCQATSDTNTTLVFVQYRLGPFGFLAHPSTFAETGITGNWGLLDQQMALRWVQANIQGFGGNSTIMLWGQNAGAISVGLHVIMPGSKGLFSSAVSESGGAGYSLKTQNAAYTDMSNLAGALACPSNPQEQLACLRNASETDILANIPDIPSLYQPTLQTFFPIVDGQTIPQQPLMMIQNNNFNQVPYMIGVNADEGTAFVYDKFGSNATNITENDVQAFVKAVWPGIDPSKVLEYTQYYVGNYYDPFAQLSGLWSDYYIGCPSFEMLKAISGYAFPPGTDCKPPLIGPRTKRGATNQPCTLPLYLYWYSLKPAGCPAQFDFLGATSGRELMLTLDLPASETGCYLNSTESALAQDVSYAFGSMARLQTPAFRNTTAWNYWTVRDQTTVTLDAPQIYYQTIEFATRCKLFKNLNAPPPPESSNVTVLAPGTPVNSSLTGFPLGLLSGNLPSPPPPKPSSVSPSGSSSGAVKMSPGCIVGRWLRTVLIGACLAQVLGLLVR